MSDTWISTFGQLTLVKIKVWREHLLLNSPMTPKEDGREMKIETPLTLRFPSNDASPQFIQDHYYDEVLPESVSMCCIKDG